MYKLERIKILIHSCLLIRIRHIGFVFFHIYLGISTLVAQDIEGKQQHKTLKKNFPQPQDSVVIYKNSPVLSQKDRIPKDTLPVKPKKEAFQDIIEHSADDYIEIDVRRNLTRMYKHAKLHYQDVDLEAGMIEIDYKNHLIIARGIIDSTGAYTQIPYFKQGKEETIQDSIRVNYETERALIWGLNSQQDNGIFLHSGVSKKVNDTTLYVRDIKITTSKKKNPDYYIGIRKAKIVPKKKIIAGSSQLYIADVPTPIWIPFAYFPLTQSRTSGILMPTYGENARQGYFLQNGGYYFAISDYFDLALTGDIYSNGSWSFRTQSKYKYRYHFSGSFGFSYDVNINSIRGFSDYSKTSRYNIRWSHSQDANFNPNMRLSASVNLGSSKYYRESINEFHTNANQNNTLSSSVSFSKKFVGTPFNLSLSATHTQNTNTEEINMSLPSLQLSMDRIYPFAPKEGAARNPLQKLGLSYALSGDYRIKTTDAFFFKPKMFDGAKKGIKHTASLSTNMKLFKFFTLNPSANYTERWYFDYLKKTYDPGAQKLVIDTLNGFKSLREYNAGMSLSTNIYGTFRFKKGRLKAIRHTIRPSVTYSYRPDFSFYDETVFNPETGEMEKYSPFKEGIYGRPGSGVSNNLSFSVNNSFEAKLMPKDSTKKKAVKVPLLNSLRFSTNYNMTADTLRWSPLNMNTGFSILKNKMHINIAATMDPYALNLASKRINTFNISNGGSLFRLTSANLTMSYNLSNKTFEKTTRKSQNENDPDVDTGIPEEDMRKQSKNRQNEKSNVKKLQLYHAKIPWKLNLSYSLHYANGQRQNEFSTNSLMFSGNIELTPKWGVGFSSGYDFKGKGMGYTTLNFERDLDSWKMRFSWVPFGDRSTYYFFIGVKSSVLSDLKYDKRKLPDKRLF